MKLSVRKLLIGLGLLSALNLQLSTCLAQGTAFTYQGRLDSGGSPASGRYDLRFTLHDAASGGNQWGSALTNPAVAVSNGLFTTTLDFGFGVFNGGPRWLEIAVRTNGGGGFTTLAPRQALLPTPSAFWAANAGQAVTVSGTVPASGLNGLYSNPVSFNNPANGFAGDGSGLNNVNAATLGGRTAAQFWQTGGNAGTSPGTHFLGTTDNQPLELRVNGQRAMRIEPDADSPNLVGGCASNTVAAGLEGATIAGGGLPLYPNRITNHYATIGGGTHNLAGGAWATIAGGRDNLATGQRSTVGGGEGNAASGLTATVSGGSVNTASNSYATVGGGVGNIASGWGATVGGGSVNTASGYNATVPGGRENRADGLYSFAAGRQARALHHGSFVWADQQEADFDSTTPNQFNVRASGGARFETGGAGLTVDGRAALLSPAPGQPQEFFVNNAGAWRLMPTATSPNIIGGYARNVVSNGVVGAFIGGGGSGFELNRVGGNFASVLGGKGNTASGESSTAMGELNVASGIFSTAMGVNTIASGGAATAMGVQTTASGNGSTALGFFSIASGHASMAAGTDARALHLGSFVWADATSSEFSSTTSNQFSIRASGGVRLNNDTSLSFGNQTRQMINLWNAEYGIGVQSDTTYFRSGNDFAWFKGGSHEDAAGSPGPDGSVLMRLTRDGNLGLGTTPAHALDVARGQAVGRFTTILDPNGAVLVLQNLRSSPTYLGAINFETDSATPGQIGYLASDQMTFRVGGQERMSLNASGLTVNGVFVSSSDRNAKENFEPVDPQEVLEKVAALPLSRWNYKDDAGARHIGPMAQDFHAAFGVGPDDKHIATVDADGVALAAIQGLNQKLEETRAENAALKQRLAELEELVRALAAQGKGGAQ